MPLLTIQVSSCGEGELVTADAVFKVCDQPQPLQVKQAIDFCCQQRTADALRIIARLHDSGYAATDIIQTMFKVDATQEPRTLSVSLIALI